jgi:hypothetical protein
MKFLKAIDSAVSRVSPLIFILLYIMTGIGFGFLYYKKIPDGFYAPYARYEPAAREDIAKIVRQLGSVIKVDVKGKPPKYWQLSGLAEAGQPTPAIDPAAIHAANFDMADDGIVKVDILAPGYASDAQGKLDHSKPFQVWMNVSFPALAGPIAGDQSGSYYPIALNTEKYTNPKELQEAVFHLIFDRTINITLGPKDEVLGVEQQQGKSETSQPMIRIDPAASQEIFNVYFGIHGHPDRFSGNLGRMLYFSSVVITTLGLGDIVPITDEARTFVAIEAMIGIILIGLFLNSIAARAGKSKTP